jgi:hypothetical protein
MNQLLRVLMVEDSEDDATLLLPVLRRGGDEVVLEAGQISCVQCPEGYSYKIIDSRSWCAK